MKSKKHTNNSKPSMLNNLNSENWISYENAAIMLGLCKRTLEKLVSEGTVSYIKAGRRVLFDPNKLKAEIWEIYGVNKTESWNSLK